MAITTMNPYSNLSNLFIAETASAGGSESPGGNGVKRSGGDSSNSNSIRYPNPPLDFLGGRHNYLVDIASDWASQYDGPNGQKGWGKVDFKKNPTHNQIDHLLKYHLYYDGKANEQKASDVENYIKKHMLDGIIHNIKEYYKHGEGKGSPNGTMEKAIDDSKKYWSESGQNECLKIKDEVYQHCQDASLNQLVDLWASQYDGPNGRKAGEKVDFNTPAFHQTFKRYLKGIIDFIMSSPKYEHDDYDQRKIKAVMYSVVTDKKNGALYPGGALYERIENHYRHGSGKGSPGGTMEKAQKAWSEYYDHGEKKGQQEALAIVDELCPFPSS